MFFAVSQALVGGVWQRSPGFCSREAICGRRCGAGYVFLEHCPFSTIIGWYSTRHSVSLQSYNRKNKRKKCKILFTGICARKSI